MFIHTCKKELCPHCTQMNCSCEQTFKDTTAGWKLVCPFCSGIMMECTVTTSGVMLTGSLSPDTTQCTAKLFDGKAVNDTVKKLL